MAVPVISATATGSAPAEQGIHRVAPEPPGPTGGPLRRTEKIISRTFVDSDYTAGIRRQHAVLHPGHVGVAVVVVKSAAYLPGHDIVDPVVAPSVDSVTIRCDRDGVVE